jgi:hypothetical protein
MKEPKQDKDERNPNAKEAPPKGSTKPLAQKIGFERLDLTVEEVEERISPRETNVFDK